MLTYKNKKIPFEGAATAIVTPFSRGEIDYDAFRKLVLWQVEMGIDALCVIGTTGEAHTLSRAERRRLIACAREAAPNTPLLVGCGSADTRTACLYAGDAAMLSADALLAITPYCNKGTRGGIHAHFQRVADSARGLPVILYNVPSRTGVNLGLSQYAELSAVENIVAVKEAAPDIAKITRIASETDLAVYSGNDDMILPVAAVGGKGVISVLSNLVPAAVAVMTRAAIEGDVARAAAEAHRYAKLISLLFAETNPAPVKYTMELLGLCSGEMRLPMAEIGDDLKAKLKAELTRLEII